MALRITWNELKVPYNDPIDFLASTKCFPTHVFDLSRVDETGSVDIVNNLCTRLKLEDRLKAYKQNAFSRFSNVLDHILLTIICTS